MPDTKYFLDGYAFETKEEYNIALREKKNVNSIRQKINMNNKESVLLIYKKITSRKLLISPIGIAFLMELRTHLIQNLEVEESELPMIQIPSKRMDSLDRSRQFTSEQLLREIKKKNRTIVSLRIVVAGLAVAIAAMFFLTIKSDNFGYINAENKIINKYSSWEAQLNEREQKIKDKEEKLGIEIE